MKRSLFLLVTIIAVLATSCSQKLPNDFVLVEGGRFMNHASSYYGKDLVVPDFHIARHEVTQKEWREVMGTNPSEFRDDDLPVESVSWYDCIEYCNKRSVHEGFAPYYRIDKQNKDPHNMNELDDVNWTVTINAGANGYRLPTEVEWEYAAGGGHLSRNYPYAGSDKLDEAGWYWKNSGDAYLTGNWSWPVLLKNHNRPRPVGGKIANELGLYDMSGNVREWCWDWYEASATGDAQGRSWRGGGWIGADFCCEITFRAGHQPNGKGPDQGLRLCRDGER